MPVRSPLRVVGVDELDAARVQLERVARERGGDGARAAACSCSVSCFLPSLRMSSAFSSTRMISPLVDDADAIGHLLGLVDVVRREDDRDARCRAGRARRSTCRGAARRRRPRSARRGTGFAARATSAFAIITRRFMPPESVMILLSFLSQSDSDLQHLLDTRRVARLAEQAAAEGRRVPDRLERVGRRAPAARGRSASARRAESLTMSWPSTVTLPAVAFTMPQTMLISVVLPAPFGPSSAKISPRRMSRSCSSARRTRSRRSSRGSRSR